MSGEEILRDVVEDGIAIALAMGLYWLSTAVFRWEMPYALILVVVIATRRRSR